MNLSRLDSARPSDIGSGEPGKTLEQKSSMMNFLNMFIQPSILKIVSQYGFCIKHKTKYFIFS